jgi:hypothetical protein
VNGAGAATFGQEHCGLSCGVSASHHCDILRVIEYGLDGSARVVNPGGFKPFSTFGIELSPVYAGGNQHRAGAKQRSAVQM